MKLEVQSCTHLQDACPPHLFGLIHTIRQVQSGLDQLACVKLCFTQLSDQPSMSSPRADISCAIACRLSCT